MSVDPAMELAGELARIKSEAAATGGKVVNIEGAIARMEAAQLQIQQAQAAETRRAREQAAAAGGVADLGVYSAKADQVTRDNAAAFRSVDGQAPIQLVGAYRKHVVGGGADVILSWQPGLLDDPHPRSTAHLQLQRVAQDRAIARHLLAADKRHTPYLDHQLVEAARACSPEIGKIFADSTGIGAEWVPDNYLPELERDVVAPTGFAGMFRQRILPAGTTKIPSKTGRLRAYKGGAPTLDDPAEVTASTWSTDKSTIDPVSLAVAAYVDRDFSEDSILAILPEVTAEMAAAFRWAVDDCIINGDTTASHQDAIATWDGRGELGGTTGLGTSADPRRSWIGLRARAADLQALHSAGVTDQNGAKTYAGLLLALAKLGPKNMMLGHAAGANIVVAPSWEYFFNTMLGWSEFATWDKVGAMASVVTGRLGGGGPAMLPGQVGYLTGMLPVCIAAPLTADLASTGLYTGSGSTTGMLQFDRSRFEMCYRQGMRFESEARIGNNTVFSVARTRAVFRAQDAAAAGIKDVHYSINL